MYNKLSKKEKKKINTSKRKVWGDYSCQSPVTKVIPNRKKEEIKYLCRKDRWEG